MNNRFGKLISKISDKADGALITSDINRRYFCGMKSSAGFIAVFEDEAYLLIDFRYIEQARATAKDCTVILLENLTNQLSELFVKHSAYDILVESETMTVAELNSYISRFDGVNFISDNTLSDAITELRTAKSNDEIEKITKAQRIAEGALEKLVGEITEGVSERTLALRLNQLMLDDGAEDISFETIVLFGENSSKPHGVPSQRQLKKGDNILIDFGAVYDGYHSDMTRTFCFGEPTAEFAEVYNIVLDAQEAALNAARAGLTGAQLDKTARDIIDAAGYEKEFGHSLGHGVGMEIHESPTASSRSKALLKENSVVTIEPGIYLEKKFGIRIEDFVVLNKNNCTNLTLFPKTITII